MSILRKYNSTSDKTRKQVLQTCTRRIRQVYIYISNDDRLIKGGHRVLIPPFYELTVGKAAIRSYVILYYIKRSFVISLVESGFFSEDSMIMRLVMVWKPFEGVENDQTTASMGAGPAEFRCAGTHVGSGLDNYAVHIGTKIKYLRDHLEHFFLKMSALNRSVDCCNRFHY